MEQRFYSAYHKNKEVADSSSSGGVFAAISDIWLEKKDNAVVYGCILDENLNAVHHRAQTKEERNKMFGSKYIGSDVSGVFKRVGEDLENGYNVLFSGTPCQVAGLKAYLNACKVSFAKEQLLTVEVICHGVGSVRFFHDYISHLEKKYKSKAISCKFRAKNKPWQKQDMEVVFKNGKKYNSPSISSDWFYNVYVSKNYILRPSCYVCPWASMEREADISLADLWRENEQGVKAKSVIIVNTPDAKLIIEKCNELLEIESITRHDFSLPNLTSPTKKPEKYIEFWDIYQQKGYLYVQKFVGNNTLKGKVVYCLTKVLNYMNLVPIMKRVKGILK